MLYQICSLFEEEVVKGWGSSNNILGKIEAWEIGQNTPGQTLTWLLSVCVLVFVGVCVSASITPISIVLIV